MSDDESLNKAEKARKERLDIERAEMTKVLSDPAMLYFLWRLISYCGVYQSFAGLDPDQRAVHSGMREVGLWAIAELSEHDPHALDRMRKENAERVKLLQLEAQNKDDDSND